MEKFRNIIFTIFGIFGIISQTLGLYIIALLLAIMTKYYFTIIIIITIITLVDYWKHKHFKKQGKKATFAQYQ